MNLPRPALLTAVVAALALIAASSTCIDAAGGDKPTRTEKHTTSPRTRDNRPTAIDTAGKVRHVVAAIGDSITDKRSHGGKFLDYLQKKCPGSRFDNYGHGGWMVNQMRRRFARDVFGDGLPSGSKPHYTDVIIFGGVNDMYSDKTAGRTPHKIERDLKKMYDMAHEHHVRVIAVTVSPWGGFRRYYNQRRGCATLQVNAWIRSRVSVGLVDVVVDSYPLLSCGNPEFLCDVFVKPFNDGLHFGPAAHEKLGQAMYRAAFQDCL